MIRQNNVIQQKAIEAYHLKLEADKADKAYAEARKELSDLMSNHEKGDFKSYKNTKLGFSVTRVQKAVVKWDAEALFRRLKQRGVPGTVINSVINRRWILGLEEIKTISSQIALNLRETGCLKSSDIASIINKNVISIDYTVNEHKIDDEIELGHLKKVDLSTTYKTEFSEYIKFTSVKTEG